jgi:cephalosporin hydroxylase
MDPIKQFEEERKNNIKKLATAEELKKLATKFYEIFSSYRYQYNFSWLNRPIIQIPQDIVALQEIITIVKPDLIIETGVAHGGSLIFYASLLELLGQGQVVGIDIDIRAHNRQAIEAHFLSKRIKLIEGSSVDQAVFDQVVTIAKNHKKVLVCLDSLHTHEHVLKELKLYSQLVSSDSYLVVFDTIIEQMPDDFSINRPWGKGNNPQTAVSSFMKDNKEFVIDRQWQDKLLITAAPDGYLKKL